MEKVICALWRDPDIPREVFAARLRTDLPQTLRKAGASRIRINIADAAVEPAASLVQRWQDPQQEAVVQYWLPSANARFRAGADRAIAAHAARFAAWLVAESTVIANTAHAPPAGERTFGWAQASFITFRADLPRASALAHWHDIHTPVAIETQANFEYVQHAILCALTPKAPAYDAFVEECFPPEAMTDPAAFFAATGDDAKLRANIKAMMASCGAFLDFARNDIVPTSQFDIGDPA
jgi:hypothetical protein